MRYTNSQLVTYKRLTSKHSGVRKQPIDTISIHCYVGQITAKKGCDYFATTDRDASCNYVVGKDGSIGLCVEEKNRSWCTSSPANDNRAVTIEVASDTKHPYKITDEAYAALIKLCADICKRNNIEELKWKGDKTLIGKVDKQNMTVHRWFSSKACPGDYLYNMHGEIAKEVNTILREERKEKEVTEPEKVNVTYAVKIEGGKILPAVRNLEDYAGIENEEIIGIAIKVDKGSIRYQVHELGGDWLPWVSGYDWKDHENGYAGNGSPIDAIRVYYETPSDLAKNGGYREAKYRISPFGSEKYYSWQLDDSTKDGMDGYAGAYGKEIDKIQIVIE